MNEIELVQAIQGNSAVVLSCVQWTMTIITGYLLIAHFIGTKLTFLQVSFVNSLFLLMHGSAALTVNLGIRRDHFYTAELLQMRPETPALGYSGEGAVAQIVLAILLAAGCLYFMWSARHPKTE